KERAKKQMKSTAIPEKRDQAGVETPLRYIPSDNQKALDKLTHKSNWNILNEDFLDRIKARSKVNILMKRHSVQSMSASAALPKSSATKQVLDPIESKNKKQRWENLRYMIGLVRSTFVSEKKDSMPYEQLVEKLCNKYKNSRHMTILEMDKQLKLLESLSCKFLTIKTGNTLAIANINKSIHQSNQLRNLFQIAMCLSLWPFVAIFLIFEINFAYFCWHNKTKKSYCFNPSWIKFIEKSIHMFSTSSVGLRYKYIPNTSLRNICQFSRNYLQPKMIKANGWSLSSGPAIREPTGRSEETQEPQSDLTTKAFMISSGPLPSS
ncbi:hypothetical protein RFI_03000, partial [Reticulomyxa filosa]